MSEIQHPLHILTKDIIKINFPQLPNGTLYGNDAMRINTETKVKLTIDNFCKFSNSNGCINDWIKFLEILVERIENVLKSEKMTWLEVKATKGKTDKSKKCSMEIWKGFEPTAENISHYGCHPEQGTSTFHAPTSMIYTKENGTSWLPTFFVRQKLSELSSRSSYKSGRYSRLPIQSDCWPQKQQYLDVLLSQLPTQDEVDQNNREKEQQDKIKEREDAIEREKQQKEYEISMKKKKAAKEKDEAKKAAAKAKKRAKMEQLHNVNVVVSYSDQAVVDGYKKWVRNEYEVENVSLYFSGQRVYIVESDGEETISTRPNVTIKGEGGDE